MRHLVRLQMPLGDERLRAGVACEGALPSVRADVRFQVPRLLKVLQT